MTTGHVWAVAQVMPVQRHGPRCLSAASSSDQRCLAASSSSDQGQCDLKEPRVFSQRPYDFNLIVADTVDAPMQMDRCVGVTGHYGNSLAHSRRS